MLIEFAKYPLHRPRWPFMMAVACFVAASGVLPALGQDQQPARQLDERRATLVRLRLPLTGNADAAFRGVALRAKSRLLEGPKDAAQRPVLVIEFAPNRESEGLGSDFERALSLARFLTSDEMAAVKTVAFIPETIKGHAVLVALACEEIAISSSAEMGLAGLDEPADRPIDPTVIAGYKQIAAARLTAPAAVALGMLDPSLEVIEVTTEQGKEYVTADELPELEEQVAIVKQEVLFAAGALGTISGREARQMAVAKYQVDNRAQLARLLRLPPEQLEEAGTLIADWRPIVFDIDGPITQKTVSYVRRLVGNEVNTGRANFVLLRINSSGGDWSDAQQLASLIASFRDKGENTRVVTYVPTRASGSAALVALAGEQLVMHSSAQLGGLIEGDPPLEGPGLELLRQTLRDSLAAETRREGSLLVAFADTDAELFRYSNRKTGENRLLDEQAAKTLDDAGDWQQGEAITKPGDVLALTGDEALELGVVTHVVSNYDDLLQLYGLLESPREVRATWSVQIADALSSPAMQVLLLVLAFVGIYFELNTPGMGIGGFVAALAILLFFWSKALDGTVEWLEVLLFFGGVVAVLIEFFVLPGVGIFGIGGGIMVVAAIILAGQRTLLPSNERDWASLEQSLIVLLSTAVGIVVATMLMRRFLPHIPVLNGMMLAPPDAGEAAQINTRESMAAYAHLVGQRGIAATPLMPSGKISMDGDLIDVVTGGEAIDRGATVEIVAVRGNRVTVKQI